MGVSIVATVAMGFTRDWRVMAALVGINGLAQATGWSGNVGTMAGWFYKSERGRVMGAWSTNFNIGSLVSGWTMAWVLGAASPLQWRWCFYTGAAVLSVIWVVFYVFQRNRPEDVGLMPVDDPATPIDEAKVPDPPPEGFMGLSRGAWTNLMLVAGFYFFVKFVRYAIWSWAPYFIHNYYKVGEGRSNLYATAFDLLGLPGVYLTGWLSDRYFASRRSEVATAMMIASTLCMGLLMIFFDAGLGAFIPLLAFVGFTVYGPDALLTGAGAMDIGGRRSATFAAAVISGFGSMGSIVQELVISRVYDPKTGSLEIIFGLLLGSAAIAAVFCAILVVRNRRGGKGI
jgi:OPA family sugar phosphate sensor protein UhpC-like MFS transporter